MAKTPIQQNPCRCYVYEIVVDGVVRYIGKGTKYRAESHRWEAGKINRRRQSGEVVRTSRFYNKLAKALREATPVEHRFIAAELSDEDAFKIEITEIARIAKGQLWNILPGGEGGNPEYSRQILKRQWSDPEFRAARLMAIRAANGPDKNAKISETLRKRWADKEFHAEKCAAIKAACGTAEMRARRSADAKAAWARDGAKKKRGLAVSIGQKASLKFTEAWQNPENLAKRNLGIRASWAANPDRRKKQSAAAKARWDNPEMRAKMLAKRKNRSVAPCF